MGSILAKSPHRKSFAATGQLDRGWTGCEHLPGQPVSICFATSSGCSGVFLHDPFTVNHAEIVPAGRAVAPGAEISDQYYPQSGPHNWLRDSTPWAGFGRAAGTTSPEPQTAPPWIFLGQQIKNRTLSEIIKMFGRKLSDE